MKTTSEKTSLALKDLIVINNDRYEGYKKAAEEAKDADLKGLFHRFSLQSKQFSEELQNLMPDKEEMPDEGETKNTGKLYRVWMDMKNAIAGNNRKAVLSSCEFGEDVAKKHYETVLEKPEDLSNEVLEVIRKQFAEIKKGHDTVKSMRDSA